MEPGTSRVSVIHPDHPDSEMKGSLTWHPGSGATITLDDLPASGPSWLVATRIPILYVLAPYKATLTDALIVGQAVAMSPAGTLRNYTLAAPLTFFGDLLDADTAMFKGISVEVIGCSSWFGTIRIETTTDDSNGVKYSTCYYLPSDSWLELSDGSRYGFGIVPNTSRSDRHGVHILGSETSTLYYCSTQDQSVASLLRSITIFVSFIEFAMDETVWIERVFTSKSDSNERNLELGAKWKQGDKPGRSFRHCLIPFAKLEHNFECHLSKWLELYNKLPLALDLYRECNRISELAVELRFFSITLALEGLHQSLFKSKNPTLATRLQEIVKKHSHLIKELLSENDCARVAATRNYLAHQTQRLREKAIPTKELSAWYRRLLMVFEICLLAELPFDPNALEQIVSQRWARIKSGQLGEWNF